MVIFLAFRASRACRARLFLFQRDDGVPGFFRWWSLEVLVAEREIELRGPVFPREIDALLKGCSSLIPRTAPEGRQPFRKDRAGFTLRLLHLF